MLTSLEIKNFRTFSHLAIERLGRVNLIVGKNNVGKTTLLEALCILGSTRPAETVLSILQSRNEVRPSADLASSGERKPHYALESLVHGRTWRNLAEVEIIAGSSGGDNYQVTVNTVLSPPRGDRDVVVHSPVGEWTLSADGSASFVWSDTTNPIKLPTASPPLVDVPGGAETEISAGSWWDDVWLTSGKEQVLKLLKTVAPIEDVIFMRDPRSQHGRLAKAQIEGVDEPIPLAALGGGVARLFHIALAMEYAAKRAEQIVRVTEQARDAYAFVMIDEVESGIHHGLHADLWRFVLHAARRLDVQVFAATHSWDCIEGFQQAVSADPQSDAMLIRLESMEGRSRAVLFDETELPIVTREKIEVR